MNYWVFAIKACYFLIFLLWTKGSFSQNLTVSSSGESGTSGSNWSISGGVLSISGTANIRASVIETALASGDLLIEGNTSNFSVTISEAISVSSGGKNFTIGASTNTGSISIGQRVSLNGAINIFGGNISINEHLSTTNSSTITLDAETGSQLSFTGSGVLLASGKSITTSGAGNILITGRGGNSNAGSQFGIQLGAGSSIISTGNGNITLSGIGGNGGTSKNYGVRFTSGSNINIATENGNITITGEGSGIVGSSDNDGINIQTATINAKAGTITIDGGADHTGLNSESITYEGTITIGGVGQSGNIVLRGNDMWSRNVGVKTIQTSGTLAIEPSGNSFSSAISFPFDNFSLNSITALRLGKSGNSSAITIGSALSIAGPISIYGGTINMNGNLNSTATDQLNKRTHTLIGSNIILGVPIVLDDDDIIIGGSTSVTATSLNHFRTNGIGKLRRSIAYNESFTFPVGTVVNVNGISVPIYLPVRIKNNEAATREYYLSLSNGVFTNGSTSGVAESSTSPRFDVTWNIGNNIGSASAPGIDISMNWNPQLAGNFLTGSGTMTNPSLFHHNGTAWEKLTGATSYDMQAGTFLYTGYSGSFSPFTIAESNASLPLTWLNFTGKKVKHGIELSWSTSSEQNTKDFQVQYSINAQEWTSLGYIPAAGNSNVIRNYRYVHNEPLMNNIKHYYRILQRDEDGKYSYSKIIRIEYPESTSEIVLYPNPAKDVFYVNLNRRQGLQLVSMQGEVVWNVILSAGHHEIPIFNFAKGIYILKTETKSYKVIIQ